MEFREIPDRPGWSGGGTLCSVVAPDDALLVSAIQEQLAKAD
jgi:hypothetical protein